MLYRVCYESMLNEWSIRMLQNLNFRQNKINLKYRQKVNYLKY